MTLKFRRPGAVPPNSRIVFVGVLVALAAFGPGLSCRTTPLVRRVEPGELVRPARPVEPTETTETTGMVESTELPAEPEPVMHEPVPPPSREEVLQNRYFARWDCILVGDWRAVYEFLAPERRARESLEQYLRGKGDHDYSDPSIAQVLDIDADRAYLALTVFRTSPHPTIPGADDVTELLAFVETWAWLGDQWFWLSSERSRDFFRDHPELKSH